MQLLKIVEFRNGEILYSTNGAMHHSLTLLTRQNVTLTEVSQQGERDSKALRALSIVATLYMPASLVATVFSSSLVESQTLSSQQTQTHFVIASQFWIFIVVTLALMIITLCGTRWLEKALIWKSS
jgi:cell division protein FtsW (lipid II flippase)